MTTRLSNRTSIGQRLLLFTSFLLCGLSIFLFGVPYHDTFPTNGNLFFNSLVSLIFLLSSLIFSRSKGGQHYWPVAYAFFIAAFANTMLTIDPFVFLMDSDNPAREIAGGKVAQFLVVVPAIIILTKIAGFDLGSIYLKKGYLRNGLIFGLISFVLFAVIAILQSFGSGSETAYLASNWYWILIFVVANGIMEELWFRAIFLRKYAPYLGVMASIVLTALIFGISHLPATYVSVDQALLFGFGVFVLGLVGAYVMVKTDSILGSVLFHAGYDLVVIVPILDSVL